MQFQKAWLQTLLKMVFFQGSSPKKPQGLFTEHADIVPLKSRSMRRPVIPITSTHSEVKRYIHTINNALPYSGRMKRNIISQISESIEDYLLLNPDTTLEMLQTHFGTPEEIIKSCTDSDDHHALLYNVGIKKKFLSLIAAIMAAFILIGAGFVTWNNNDDHLNSGILIVENTTYQ